MYEAAAVQAGKIAADIGAGTGFVTEGLLQKGLKVIAIDQSEAMLEQLKAKFSTYKDIECRQGNAENLPLEDNSVDYAFANMYIHHVESPAIAIYEMARVLRPGGKLVITDLDKHSFNFLKDEQFDLWMGFKREDIQKWLSEAGLKNVSFDCTGGNCCASSNCGCSSASISIFAAYGEKL